MIRQQIEQAVRSALTQLGVGDAPFVVERPAQMEHGDYATNAALVAKVDAQALASALKVDGVERIEVVGKFINFFLSREAVAQTVAAAAQEGWGRSDVYAGKKVMVEYTDPNPFKEFHIGHLMSNAIGESVARLFEAAGAEVVRANYQGDVGPHVAKCIFGLLQIKAADPTVEELGKAYVLGAARYEESAEDKAAIDEINKKVYEQSDEQINTLYKKGREVSLAHFEELYALLGTKFNEYFFESETWKKGLEVVRAHTGEVFEVSDGATVFRGEKMGLHTRVFINSQGLPTYEAKDLGLLALKKAKATVDTSVTVTASEQKEYFKVVLAAAKEIAELKDIAEKTQHITHGMMRFAEGKMSSRKGNVITGESLLEDLKADARAKMGERELKDPERVAQQVAVGAIKYVVLRQGAAKDIVFDPEKSLSLEGDSGPYLQYAHTRAVSLLKKAQDAGVPAGADDAPKHASTLERVLLHFPDALARAVAELEPHYVSTYLSELAGAFNSWYASERVIGGTNPHYGVLLAQAVENTLAMGLTVLSIPAPEEM